MKPSKKSKVIAIDGPAGTGKSSCAKRLSDALGFVHVDTGALYRSIALVCIKRSLVDPQKLDEISESDSIAIVQVAEEVQLEFRHEEERDPSNRVFANGKDVTDKIRSPEVSMTASKVSAIPGVRKALLELQRRLGCESNSVLEGRDIGTVIFPDADVKFFMIASVEERAKRRLNQLEAAGANTPSFEEIKDQINQRDEGDRSRAIAPLKRAEDAILVDTSEMTLDQVVDHLIQTSREKLGC